MVPGGWLVMHLTEIIKGNFQTAVSESMVFYPDPEHQWQLHD